jgi:hypothetical protein
MSGDGNSPILVLDHVIHTYLTGMTAGFECVAGKRTRRRGSIAKTHEYWICCMSKVIYPRVVRPSLRKLRLKLQGRREAESGSRKSISRSFVCHCRNSDSKT